MKDPRFTDLAKTLVHHSCRVKSGDKVLIEAFDIPHDFTVELVKTVAAAGGRPIVSTYQQPVLCAMFQNATEEQMRALGQVERARMEAVQCYIGARGTHNISEMSDVPKEKMDLYEKFWWTPVHQEVRVPKTRWVVLRWPHPSMAQAAGMSTEAFEDFYFRVCAGVDYGQMHGQGPHRRPGHRADVQHQEHRRRRLLGRAQHPRRRVLLLPRARQRQRHGPVQLRDALPRHGLQ
jgi:aminopeptidase